MKSLPFTTLLLLSSLVGFSARAQTSRSATPAEVKLFCDTVQDLLDNSNGHQSFEWAECLEVPVLAKTNGSKTELVGQMHFSYGPQPDLVDLRICRLTYRQSPQLENVLDSSARCLIIEE